MAYSITTSAGAPVATIQDGTLNTSALSLTLIGRDYAGYGAFLNENFVYLLENFNNVAAPNNPLTGQLWYNSSTSTLQVWNTAQNRWKSVSGAITAGIAPANNVSTVGDLFWNTGTNQLFVYSGTTNGWILIGPTNTSSGTGAIVDSIKDTTATSHAVIKFLVNNNIVGIVSYDATFTPQTSILGFATINPGFNLISSSTLPGSQLTGSASNALTLNGVASGQFLRSDQNSSTQFQLQAGGGVVIANDLNMYLDAANNRVSVNSLTNNRDLNIYANVNGTTTSMIGIKASTSTVTIGNVASVVNVPGIFTANGAFTAASTTTLQGITTLQNKIVPYATGTIDIGSSGALFANVFATNLYGTLIGNISSLTSLTVSGSISVGGAVTFSNTVTIGNTVTVNGKTVMNGNVIISNVYIPTANNSPGTAGQITYDGNYMYVCVATNTWKRTNISLW